MKKSEFMKIIKEGVETALTNMEASEIYDLDLISLYEGTLDRRLGQDPAIQAKTATVQNYSKKEREELKDLVDKILEDDILDPEEKTELESLEHLETMTSELFDKINLQDPALQKEFGTAAETFRQKLQLIARKGNTQEESVMKKSGLLKVIREEVEMILTNEEVTELFGEAWKGDAEVDSTGEYADKTKAELCAMKKKLMDKESRTEKEQKKVRQINFAIRSKKDGPKFGSVDC